MDDIMTPEQRRARRREQLARLGLSAEDWTRIKALAEACEGGRRPAALEDLSRPIRVGVCPLPERRWLSGRMIGTWKGRAILVWPMSERDAKAWRIRKRPR